MELPLDGDPFGGVKQFAPPQHLAERIINRIRIEKDIAVSKRRAIFAFSALVGSIGAFCAAIIAFGGAFLESELMQLLSLFVSDPQSVLASGYDSALSILESLPITYITIFLTAFLAVLASARCAVRYAARISALQHSKVVAHA